MYQKLASFLLNIMKVCVIAPIVVLLGSGLLAWVILLGTANLCLNLGIHKMLPNVPLRQCEFDCLVSFAFNLGLGTFQRSTLRQALLRGDKKAAMESLVKYCRAGGKILKGLQIRRLDEKALFEGK